MSRVDTKTQRKRAIVSREGRKRQWTCRDIMESNEPKANLIIKGHAFPYILIRFMFMSLYVVVLYILVAGHLYIGERVTLGSMSCRPPSRSCHPHRRILFWSHRFIRPKIKPASHENVARPCLFWPPCLRFVPVRPTSRTEKEGRKERDSWRSKTATKEGKNWQGASVRAQTRCATYHAVV